MAGVKSRIGLLMVIASGGYLVSFSSQLVIAYHFGTSQALDTYWSCLALVSLLTFFISPLKEALVPALHRALRRGDVQAGRLLSAGLSLLFALMAFSAVLLWAAAGGFSRFMASSDQGVFEEIAVLIPWLLPYLCLFMLAETLNTVLISFNQVLRQAVVRILAGLVLLVTVIAVGASLGVSGLLLAQILSMATMVVISWLPLRRLRPKLLLRAWSELRRSGMIPLFVSLLLSYFFAQFYVLAERSSMIYLGAGLVSGFQYSVALVNVIVSLLALPLSNLLWSQFLDRVADDNCLAAHLLVVRACGLLFYVLTIVCVFAWFHAREIILLVYGRGAFDAASVHIASEALRATIFAAIPISLMAILGRWLMSGSGAHRQVWIGLVTTIVGLAVIGGALLAESSQWILYHWLLANAAGLVVSGAIFLSVAKFQKKQVFFAIRWFVLVVVIALVALWVTPTINWGGGGGQCQLRYSRNACCIPLLL